MKSYSVTTQMKAIEQYFPEVLFIMLYKVVLTFESVDESYRAVLFYGAVNLSVFYKLNFGTILEFDLSALRSRRLKSFPSKLSS